MRMRSLSSLLLLALCCCPFASTWAANETKYAYTHAPTVFYTSIAQGCADLGNARMRISVNVTGHFASNVTDFFISVARGLKCNRIGHDAAVSSVFFRRNDSPFITIR